MKKGAVVHEIKPGVARDDMASERSEPSLPPEFGGSGTGRSPRHDAQAEVRAEPVQVEPVQVEPVEGRGERQAPGPIDIDAESVDPPRADGGAARGAEDAASADAKPDLNLPVDPRQVSPRIGEILVASGKMADEQIDRVLEDQERDPNRRFGEIAVDKRFASQRDVDAALASQFGFSSSTTLDSGLPAEIVVAHTPYSPFAEALRSLRSQLMLRWFDGSPQQGALAITSVDRGDGKSFICSNLGVVFSQLGEKTLIIDGDLRNSTQHKKFGLPNKMGLSGMLSGRAGVEEILAVQGLPNLAILPAGPLPPNPQELLGREAFGKLLAGLAKSFDVILIDTPSAQQASDAQVVAQRARAAMIVGRKDKTKTSEISQLGAVMAGSGIKILGAALNDY